MNIAIINCMYLQLRENEAENYFRCRNIEEENMWKFLDSLADDTFTNVFKVSAGNNAGQKL